MLHCRCSPLFPLSLPPLSTIVRLPFSATLRDNERKLLLLMFRGKITPVETIPLSLTARDSSPLRSNLLLVFLFDPVSLSAYFPRSKSKTNTSPFLLVQGSFSVRSEISILTVSF